MQGGLSLGAGGTYDREERGEWRDKRGRVWGTEDVEVEEGGETRGRQRGGEGEMRGR